MRSPAKKAVTDTTRLTGAEKAAVIMLSLGEAASSRTAVEVTSSVERSPRMPDDWDPFAATL